MSTWIPALLNLVNRYRSLVLSIWQSLTEPVYKCKMWRGVTTGLINVLLEIEVKTPGKTSTTEHLLRILHHYVYITQTCALHRMIHLSLSLWVSRKSFYQKLWFLSLIIMMYNNNDFIECHILFHYILFFQINQIQSEKIFDHQSFKIFDHYSTPSRV